MLLRYAGPGPHDDGQGGTVRPGDVWEWPEEPTWGPWEPADGETPPDGAESAPAAPGVPSSAPDADSPAGASTGAGTEA